MSQSGRTVRLNDGIVIELPFRARDVRRIADIVLVLLDPDEYLAEGASRTKENAGGGEPLRNLIAFDALGHLLWKAEFPEPMDYYFQIENDSPIRAISYSGYRCLIDASDGRIVGRDYLK